MRRETLYFYRGSLYIDIVIARFAGATAKVFACLGSESLYTFKIMKIIIFNLKDIINKNYRNCVKKN